MHIRTRIALAALAILSALTLVAGTAGARRLEVSEQQFRATFERLGYNGGGVSVACRATLSGSFHSRTISKVSGSLIGYITQAAFAHPCLEGEAWMLNGVEAPEGVTSANTLPWHVRYASFSGSLPNITSIRIAIVGYAFLEVCIGNSCLYKGTEASPALFDFTLSAGRVTGLRWVETQWVKKFSGGPLCPAEVTFEGTAAVTATGTSREILVRLVQ